MGMLEGKQLHDRLSGRSRTRTAEEETRLAAVWDRRTALLKEAWPLLRQGGDWTAAPFAGEIVATLVALEEIDAYDAGYDWLHLGDRQRARDVLRSAARRAEDDGHLELAARCLIGVLQAADKGMRLDDDEGELRRVAALAAEHLGTVCGGDTTALDAGTASVLAGLRRYAAGDFSPLA